MLFQLSQCDNYLLKLSGFVLKAKIAEKSLDEKKSIYEQNFQYRK